MSLKAKYTTGQSRTGDPSVAWYKQEKGGACPKNSIPIQQLYWNEFGCNKCDPTQQVESQTAKAEQCATERMANMKYSGKTPDKGHVYPIQLAYGIGKICSACNSHRLKPQFWDAKFDKYYSEFVQGRPNINSLFQGSLRKYNTAINNSLQLAIQSSKSVQASRNPVTPMTYSNGWTTVTRKTRGGKRSTRKIRKQK